MQKKENKQYPLEKSPLYSLSNKRKLEEIIGLKKYSLNKLPKRISYFKFDTPKKDGSKREVSAPNDYLKKIQRDLYYLLSRIEKPDWLISGCKGKCYIDNARLHQRNQSKYALTLDIKSFYPNCTRKFVFKLFNKTMKMPDDVAGLLSDILTYDSEIPTGSPASQLLAFFAYKDMFNALHNLAVKYNCVFSVYVDDLAFSSQTPFNKNSLINEVSLVLKKYGHSMKHKKIRYYGKEDSKLFTGGILDQDNNLKIPNNLHLKIKTDRENLLNNTTLTDIEKDKIRRSLRGRIVSARNITPDSYPELSKAVNRKTI